MNIKLLSDGAKVPTRGSEKAAGYDLYVPKDTIVNPGRGIIPLDIAIALPSGTEGHIRPRSGFSVKGFEGHAITADGCEPEAKRFNCNVIQGTLDEDYRGNVGVIVQSFEDKPFIVTAGTRIAQLVINAYYVDTFTVTDDLAKTKRGEGGCESTGTH